jgi:hypothetical protein
MSSAYATEVNLEKLGPKVTPVRVSSRITRRGFSARAKSIMLSGQPCLTELLMGKALDPCPFNWSVDYASAYSDVRTFANFRPNR